MNIIKRIAIGSAAAFSIAGFSGGALLAQQSSQVYQANLNAQNGSGDSGTATVKVDGNQVTVSLHTMKTSANLPHAQHIHIGGNMTCPTPDADKDNDGFVSTAEGQPAYGKIKVSLTTSGDTSDKSGVAVDRFPKSDADGTITYERTFTLPEGVSAADVANGVIVQHGISELFNDKAKYDGDKKTSVPGSDLPFEATVPSLCGKLVSAPVGGLGAGGGSSAGIENEGLFAVGAAGILAAAGIYAYGRRSTNNS